MTERFDLIATPISGLTLLQRKRIGDARGYLERMFCTSELSGVSGRAAHRADQPNADGQVRALFAGCFVNTLPTPRRNSSPACAARCSTLQSTAPQLGHVPGLACRDPERGQPSRLSSPRALPTDPRHSRTTARCFTCIRKPIAHGGGRFERHRSAPFHPMAATHHRNDHHATRVIPSWTTDLREFPLEVPPLPETELELPLVDLGSAPPSNAYLTRLSLKAPEKWFPLRVLVCTEMLAGSDRGLRPGRRVVRQRICLF